MLYSPVVTCDVQNVGVIMVIKIEGFEQLYMKMHLSISDDYVL